VAAPDDECMPNEFDLLCNISGTGLRRGGAECSESFPEKKQDGLCKVPDSDSSFEA
jgi:hypothetical protein